MIIVSIFCAHEDLIELQYNSILKHVKGEYEYIIFNNATTDVQVKRIEDTCKSLDIQCLKLIPFNCPCDACKASGRNDNPSVMEGEALNQALNTLKGESIFKIDSDMFFMADINLDNELNNTDLLHVPNYMWTPYFCKTHQCKHLVEVMWAGVFGLNTNIINTDIDCKPGDGFDTFGESRILLANSNNRRKNLNLFGLRQFEGETLVVSCNGDWAIKFNSKGEIIFIGPVDINSINSNDDHNRDPNNPLNKSRDYLTMYNLSHINIYEKYQSIMKYLDRYKFPDPYFIDIITVNDIDTIIHLKSMSWWHGDSVVAYRSTSDMSSDDYIKHKKRALRRLLDDTISKPSVQHSNKEMMSKEAVRLSMGEILLKYDTDKNSGANATDWQKGHSYGDSYDEIFKRFDRAAELNILEIGVHHGGSLLAWSDYFTHANIYGVDIVDVRLAKYKDKKENVKFILSDIQNPNLKNVQFKDITFDIIIDDGSHHLSDVLIMIDNYLDTLNIGGVCIIEDCATHRTESPKRWVDIIKSRLPRDYDLTYKDLRANINRWDDFLIIIERKKLNVENYYDRHLKTETQVYNQPKTPKGLTVPASDLGYESVILRDQPTKFLFKSTIK